METHTHDEYTIQFSDHYLKGSLTAAHTEGRVILSMLCHTGREYRFAFDYGRLRFIRLITPGMRDQRVSQLLLERDFWGGWHLERQTEKVPLGEDFSFLTWSDISIRSLTDLAYTLIEKAYQILLARGIICGTELKVRLSYALSFNFQRLEAERCQALNFKQPLILPPFADPRLCFPIMQGCRKRSLYGPCSFCETFMARPYRLFSSREILFRAREKIKWLDGRVRGGYELFLTEGDAMAAPLESFEIIIRLLQREFPGIQSMATFSSVLSINGECGKAEGKSSDELQRLRRMGLTRIYLGIESGSDPVLLDMNKRASRKEQVIAIEKINEAGFESACMIITGYGGKERYEEHLEGTVEFINQGCPDRVFFSRIVPKPRTVYWSKGYTPLSRSEMEGWERQVQRRVSHTVIFRQYTQLGIRQA